MRTLSNVKGLPVFDIETGQELGEINDLCFNDKGTVRGLLMDTKGWLKRDKVIPLSAIHSIGFDSIMISKAEQLYPKRNKKEKEYFLQDHQKGLIGKSLLTTEGEKLGLVDDVYFLEELGTIVGYEVTDGFFADILEGKKVIKTNSPLTISDKAIVVHIPS